MSRAGLARALAVLSLCVPVAPLVAQSARGVVLDRTQTPVSGVVVLLLDATSKEIARALSNERGEYRVATTRPGTYRIRTMRIGFRPLTSDAFALAAGEEIVRQLALSDIPVSLDTVRIAGRNACAVRPDTAAATFELWEQVRTALTAAQLTTGNRSLNARLVSFQRTLDPGRRRRVLRQTAQVYTGQTSRPWNSLSADSLHKVGYVVAGIDGLTSFYAPDIGVLLSDVFIEDHCFRIAPASDAQRIGIAFEPTRDRRRVADIKGTIWLDRASSELRGMEFLYENLSQEQRVGEPGGELEFVRMRNGAWMISRWTIRMPVLELRDQLVTGMGGVGSNRSRVTEAVAKEFVVEGGSLALVMRNRDTLWARAPLTLVGTVTDSASGRRVPDAAVRLRGTATQATTDPTGRYELRDLLPGEYTLEVSSPSLKRVGGWHSVPVTFTDSTQSFDVMLPTADQVLGSLCRNASAGIVAGSVAMRNDTTPPPPVRVVAEWVEFQPRATEILRLNRAMDTQTDARGIFRLCNVPINTALSLRVETDKGAAEPADVRIPDGERLASVELTLDPAAQGRAVLMGVVMSDVNSQTIEGAEVALPELEINAFTDSIGRFRLSGITPGTHSVMVRRVGYQPTVATIALAPNQRLERSLLLSKAVALEAVTVEATSLSSFEENRKFGVGKFITRAELVAQESRKLSDILVNVPGITIAMNAGIPTVASSRRGSVSMSRTQAEPNSPKRVPVQSYCYAQVYFHDALVFRGEQGEAPFNINSVPIVELEGIEYYASSAMVPPKYTRGNPRCGVIVIHTRRDKDPAKKP